MIGLVRGNTALYNNVTSVCIFSDCWPWSTKGHTHRRHQIHVNSCEHILVFLFSCPKNPSINHLNFYFIKQIDYIFPCVYCNRSLMMSQRERIKKYNTRRSWVAWLLFFTRCDIFCDVLQYTHTEKCYLFVLYNKHSNSLLNGFWGVF